MSLVDAKSYLYRHPYATTDVDDPKVIIEGLVKELQGYKDLREQYEQMRGRALVSERKADILLRTLIDLVHSKSKMTHKRLRDVHRELGKLK